MLFCVLQVKFIVNLDLIKLAIILILNKGEEPKKNKITHEIKSILYGNGDSWSFAYDEEYEEMFGDKEVLILSIAKKYFPNFFDKNE